MYKAKITSAEKVRHQANNSDFLDVSFDIIDTTRSLYKVLQGLEYPIEGENQQGMIHKIDDILKLTVEQAGEFAEGLIERVKGDVVQVSKRISMDIASTKEEVVEEVNKHIAEHEREIENAELDAEKEKANANIKDIQDNLVGLTIEKESEKETVETPTEGENRPQE